MSVPSERHRQLNRGKEAIAEDKAGKTQEHEETNHLVYAIDDDYSQFK